MQLASLKMRDFPHQIYQIVRYDRDFRPVKFCSSVTLTFASNYRKMCSEPM